MVLHDTPALPDAGDGYCCLGAVMRGPDGCTCWTDVHDRDQAEPDPTAVQLLAAGVTPSVRPQMCGDCAYRPGSPERTGDDRFRGDAELLEDLAADGTRFWCHDGMRRRLGRTFTVAGHPAMSVPSGPGDYAPPIVDAVPYRADGQPGLLCAGWDARRRALTARRTEVTGDA
ncbi:MAG TPA: hypothetical protein VGD67_26860 [Pseudonocardiaceae bacterium]